MKPIYIILYVVIITLLLTLFVVPRSRQVTPAVRRLLWLTSIAGLAVLIVVTVLFLI
jgi:hypothetical protein